MITVFSKPVYLSTQEVHNDLDHTLQNKTCSLKKRKIGSNAFFSYINFIFYYKLKHVSVIFDTKGRKDIYLVYITDTQY